MCIKYNEAKILIPLKNCILVDIDPSNWRKRNVSELKTAWLYCMSTLEIVHETATFRGEYFTYVPFIEQICNEDSNVKQTISLELRAKQCFHFLPTM